MTITSKTPRDRPIPDHLCEVCRKACGFGIGFDEHAKWYCRQHIPADFFAKSRYPDGKHQVVATLKPPGQEMAISERESLIPQGISPGPKAHDNQQIDLFGTL